MRRVTREHVLNEIAEAAEINRSSTFTLLGFLGILALIGAVGGLILKEPNACDLALGCYSWESLELVDAGETEGWPQLLGSMSGEWVVAVWTDKNAVFLSTNGSATNSVSAWYAEILGDQVLFTSNPSDPYVGAITFGGQVRTVAPGWLTGVGGDTALVRDIANSTLYRWAPPAGPLQLVARDIPPAMSGDVRHDAVAWLDGFPGYNVTLVTNNSRYDFVMPSAAWGVRFSDEHLFAVADVGYVVTDSMRRITPPDTDAVLLGINAEGAWSAFAYTRGECCATVIVGDAAGSPLARVSNIPQDVNVVVGPEGLAILSNVSGVWQLRTLDL